MKMITLKSGVKIPVLGLGTDNMSQNVLGKTIENACELGYQLFDTATAYQNHHVLSKARKNIKPFICTKINNGDLIKYNTIDNAVNQILTELDINKLDCLLLHNPSVANFTDIFKKQIALKERGIIKSIGVSNFTVKHLTQLLDVIDHVDINEVELHPFLTQPELVTFCRKHNITIVAYRPFGFGMSDLLENETLLIIAKNHKKTVSQVILRWLIQQGHCAIPKSSNKEHLKQNLNIFDFSLTESEITQIQKLDKNLRTCTGPWADFND